MKIESCGVVMFCCVDVETRVSSAYKRAKKPEFAGFAVMFVWGIPAFPHDIEEVFFFKRNVELHDVGVLGFEPRLNPPHGLVLPLHYTPITFLQGSFYTLCRVSHAAPKATLPTGDWVSGYVLR